MNQKTEEKLPNLNDREKENLKKEEERKKERERECVFQGPMGL